MRRRLYMANKAANEMKWGDRVAIKAVLDRDRTDGKKYVGKRFWRRTELDKFTLGTFLAKASFWDGIADYDPEDGKLWTPTKHHHGAFVIIESSIHVSRVFIEDISLEDNHVMNNFADKIVDRIVERLKEKA